MGVFFSATTTSFFTINSHIDTTCANANPLKKGESEKKNDRKVDISPRNRNPIKILLKTEKKNSRGKNPRDDKIVKVFIRSLEAYILKNPLLNFDRYDLRRRTLFECVFVPSQKCHPIISVYRISGALGQYLKNHQKKTYRAGTGMPIKIPPL